MTTTPADDPAARHAANARTALNHARATNVASAERDRYIATAAANATLALAEEQRTANLLARAALGLRMATAEQLPADASDLQDVLARTDERLVP